MDFVIWALIILVVAALLYAFVPAFRRKAKQAGDKIDRHTDNGKDGPFR